MPLQTMSDLVLKLVIDRRISHKSVTGSTHIGNMFINEHDVRTTSEKIYFKTRPLCACGLRTAASAVKQLAVRKRVQVQS